MTRNATTWGMQDGFDYEGFNFTDAFPVPDAYVVAYGMAHFQGPDGHLWFAPDLGAGKHGIDWAYPQNVAEFDLRQEPATTPPTPTPSTRPPSPSCARRSTR